jgi:hypothetical protein
VCSASQRALLVPAPFCFMLRAFCTVERAKAFSHGAGGSPILVVRSVVSANIVCISALTVRPQRMLAVSPCLSKGPESATAGWHKSNADANRSNNNNSCGGGQGCFWTSSGTVVGPLHVLILTNLSNRQSTLASI